MDLDELEKLAKEAVPGMSKNWPPLPGTYQLQADMVALSVFREKFNPEVALSLLCQIKIQRLALDLALDDAKRLSDGTLHYGSHVRARAYLSQAEEHIAKEERAIYCAHVSEIPSLSMEPHEIADPVSAEVVCEMWGKLKLLCEKEKAARLRAEARLAQAEGLLNQVPFSTKELRRKIAAYFAPSGDIVMPQLAPAEFTP